MKQVSFRRLAALVANTAYSRRVYQLLYSIVGIFLFVSASWAADGFERRDVKFKAGRGNVWVGFLLKTFFLLVEGVPVHYEEKVAV